MNPDKKNFFPIRCHGNQCFEWNFNFLNNNEGTSHKDHFCKVCLQLATWCRRRCCLKCGQTNFCTGVQTDRPTNRQDMYIHFDEENTFITIAMQVRPPLEISDT